VEAAAAAGWQQQQQQGCQQQEQQQAWQQQQHKWHQKLKSCEIIKVTSQVVPSSCSGGVAAACLLVTQANRLTLLEPVAT
jgi:hypothetical protein